MLCILCGLSQNSYDFTAVSGRNAMSMLCVGDAFIYQSFQRLSLHLSNIDICLS